MSESLEFGPSVAAQHRERADDCSPFTACRACNVERYKHGPDGRTNHWFVKPRLASLPLPPESQAGLASPQTPPHTEGE